MYFWLLQSKADRWETDAGKTTFRKFETFGKLFFQHPFPTCQLFANLKVKAVNGKLKTGKVLLAEPFMQDMNFKRAAVLLCEHGEEGSIGFILNKKLDMRVDDLIAEFPEFNAPVFFGGPVQTDTIHYIHNVGDLLEDSRRVTSGVWWGGSFEKLKFLISSQLITTDNIRFFVGYSGWTEGQLRDEVTLGSWVVADMHPNYLFKSKPDFLWQQIMANKGDNYSVIANMPDAVTWN